MVINGNTYDISSLNIPEELWKDIPDYEGFYQASSFGRIRSLDRVTPSSKTGTNRRWDGKILKPKRENITPGYMVSLWKGGKCKDWKVARLVATAFLGKPKENIDTVNHKDGNRLNNNIDNLEWLTRADNIRHAFETGLMPCKKIRLFRDGFDEMFISATRASIYIGRYSGYVSNCLRNNRRIVDAIGNCYNLEYVTW